MRPTFHFTTLNSATFTSFCITMKNEQNKRHQIQYILLLFIIIFLKVLWYYYAHFQTEIFKFNTRITSHLNFSFHY